MYGENVICILKKIYVITISETSCGVPLGMSTGEVPANQISASSFDAPHWPHLARLNAGTYWCADQHDLQPRFLVSTIKSTFFYL